MEQMLIIHGYPAHILGIIRSNMSDKFLGKTSFEYFAGQAAKALGANSQFSLSKSEVIDWMDNKNPPTSEEMNAKITELEAEYDAQEYARKRQAEYPSIEELVVALYDTDDKADIEAKRATVKAKYPKPE